MKHYPIYVQHDKTEIESLVQSSSMCLFSTYSGEKKEMGVFNPVYQDGIFRLHLNKTDEQFKCLNESSRADLVFFDFLCNIPSYWIDELDGGVATSYYRYAEFRCKVQTFTHPEDIAKKMGCFLEKYQDGVGYAPLSVESAIYKKSLAMLGVVELRPVEVVTKWKLGQNRSTELRREIIEKLRGRNQKEDWRASLELERWMNQNQC